MDPINLGRKNSFSSDYPKVSAPEDDKTYYPSLFIEDLATDIPDEGLMTVRYRKTRETEDLRKDKCSCDLEIIEIIDCKVDKSAKKTKEDDSEDALDKLKDEYSSDDAK